MHVCDELSQPVLVADSVPVSVASVCVICVAGVLWFHRYPRQHGSTGIPGSMVSQVSQAALFHRYPRQHHNCVRHGLCLAQ
jgi:hypothetical protein